MKLQLPVLLAILIAPPAPADEPSLILAETGRYSQRWKDYRLEIIKAYKLESELPPYAKQAFAAPPYYDFADPDGFDPLTALVYYVGKDGNIKRYRVRAVHGQAAFDHFVENELARRGDQATKVGSDSKVTLTAPPYTREIQGLPGQPKSKVNTTWGNFQIAYKDRLLAFGSGAHEAPLGGIARELKLARRKFWFMRYRPDTAPKMARAGFFAEIQKSTGVKFQQLDDESDVAYRMRRTVGENYLDLFRSMLFDIQEVVAWTKIPSERNQFFTARFQLQAKPKSKLAILLNQLPSRRSFDTMREGDLARLWANVSIPEELHPALKAILASSHISKTDFGSALAEEIDRGRIQVAASLTDDATGQPILVGVANSQKLARTVASAAKLVGAESDEDGWFRIAGETQIKQESLPLKIRFVGEGENLLFNMAFDDDDERRSVRPQQLVEKSSTAARQLLSVDLDLGRWAVRGSDHPGQSLLHKLETIYMRSKPGGSMEEMRSRFRAQLRGRGPVVTYRSFLDRGNKDGDWSLKMTLRHSRDTLTADLRVGKALFDYFLIRNSFQ